MRKRLENLALAIAIIEAQQKDHPGYAMADVMEAVDGELLKMGLKEEPLEYLMEVRR